MNALASALRGGKPSKKDLRAAASKIDNAEKAKKKAKAKSQSTATLAMSGAETLGAYSLGVALEGRLGADKMKMKGWDLRAVGGSLLALFGGYRHAKGKGGTHAFAMGLGLAQSGLHAPIKRFGSEFMRGEGGSGQPAQLNGAIEGDDVLEQWGREVRTSEPVRARRLD